MKEAFSDLPFVARAIIVAFGFMLLWTPIMIARSLERIEKQNERIISLLVDIKIGRRDL